MSEIEVNNSLVICLSLKYTKCFVILVLSKRNLIFFLESYITSFGELLFYIIIYIIFLTSFDEKLILKSKIYYHYTIIVQSIGHQNKP